VFLYTTGVLFDGSGFNVSILLVEPQPTSAANEIVESDFNIFFIAKKILA
jgi:hypothetical protein